MRECRKAFIGVYIYRERNSETERQRDVYYVSYYNMFNDKLRVGTNAEDNETV